MANVQLKLVPGVALGVHAADKRWQGVRFTVLDSQGLRILTRSPIVHVDGPLSVRAGFQPGEVLDMADRAGLRGARITRHWPQRLLLSWRRP